MARPGWYNENSGRDYPFVFSRLTQTEFVAAGYGTTVQWTGYNNIKQVPQMFLGFGCVIGTQGDFIEGTHSVWLHAVRKIGRYLDFEFYSDAPGLESHKLVFTRETDDTEVEVSYTQAVLKTDSSANPEPLDDEQSLCPSADVLWEGYLVTGDVTQIDYSIPNVVDSEMRPDADYNVTNWVASSGSQLWAMLDEETASDSDYIETAPNIPGGTCWVHLSAPDVWPIVGPVSANYRIKGTAACTSLTIVLRERTTGKDIKFWVHSPPPLSYTTYNQALTQTDIDKITNWADLYFIVKAVATPDPSPVAAVSWMELNIPDQTVNPEDVTLLGEGLIVEPGLIQNLAGHYMRTVNVFNANRTRAARLEGCRAWCWPTADHTSHGHFPVRTCIQGDIRLAEGYNCLIEEDEFTNRLTIHAVVGQGLGEPGDELPIFSGEGKPQGGSFYDGSIGCDEVVRTINGIQGPHIEIVAGQGITVDTVPEDHLILIKANMQDLTGCFEQEASTSLTQPTPNQDPCDCGAE